MESSETSSNQLICPACGQPNIPGAAFCGNCGTSLQVAEDQRNEPTPDDTQTTSVYEPIRDPAEHDEQPLWSPEPPRETIIDVDPGQTSAISVEQAPPIQDRADRSETIVTTSPSAGPAGLRGFTLGTLAIILIVAVVALYLYSAWLSDSMRDTIDGWLPWMS